MNFPLPELYSTWSEPVDLKPAAPEGLAEALALFNYPRSRTASGLGATIQM